MLAQDGAALEKGLAVMAKESCWWVPTSLDAPPSFPGVGVVGRRREGRISVVPAGLSILPSNPGKGKVVSRGRGG
jgi:hypothetical protein